MVDVCRLLQPEQSLPQRLLPYIEHRLAGRWSIEFSGAQLFGRILLYPSDVDKTTFMTEGPTYCYQVMPFSLKNTGATYQCLMDKVFAKHIGCNLEVYVDTWSSSHPTSRNTSQISRNTYERGPKVDRSASLAVVLLVKSRQESTTIFSTPEKPTSFHWNNECEKAFQNFKQFLASPPVLMRSIKGRDLYLYLVVSENAISAIIYDTTGHRISISDDRESRPCPRHLGQTVTPLFPLSCHGCPNRQPHLTCPPIARIGRKDDGLVNGTLQVCPQVRAERSNQDLSVGRLPGRDDLSSQRGPMVDIPRGWFDKYKALLLGLDLALEVETRRVCYYTDSQLMAKHIKGTYQVKDPLLLRYFHRA
ncbi:hypothetical protein CR513_02751, partial [Mucuna pruriens]